MTIAPIRRALLLACIFAYEGAFSEYVTNYNHVDVARWKCLLCEFEAYTGTNGRFSLASLTTTDDSDRFGRHGSFERAGTSSVVNARMYLSATSGWLLSASARNIGLDSNDIAFDIENAGFLEAKFRFQQYRRVAESDALTPFHETNGRLTLDSDWEKGSGTSGFTRLAMSNRHLELGTTRRLLESTLRVDVIPKIGLSLGHKSTSKKGTQATFRDGIFQSTALPQTIDHESVVDQVQVSYSDQRLNAAWTRSKSIFENFEPLLQWESPYRFGVLENESANTFSHEHVSDSFDVRVSLPRDGELRFHERRGQSASNPQSLKYGHSPLITESEPVRLFAEREFHSRRLLISTALSSEIDVSISRMFYEISDLRPLETLTPALGGFFLLSARSLRPGDHKRMTSTLLASYRPDSKTRLFTRVWENSLTRTNQEIEENVTRGLQLSLIRPINTQWEALATLTNESRGASVFRNITTNNSYTRRYHQADMTRRVWSGGVNYKTSEKYNFVSITVDLENRAFPDSVLGLDGWKARSLSIRYGFRLGERLLADGHVASHRRSTEINGSQSLDLAMPWTYSSDDVVKSAGLKLMIEPHNMLVDNILVDFTLSDGQAELGTLFEDSTSFFPIQISRHKSIDVLVRFKEIYETSIEVRMYVENYDGRDWSIETLNQATLANVLTMASDNPPYNNILFSLAVHRSF